MNMNKASTRTTRRQTDSQNVKDEQVLANGRGAPGLEVHRRRLPKHLLVHRQGQAQVLHIPFIMLDEDQVLVQCRVE